MDLDEDLLLDDESQDRQIEIGLEILNEQLHQQVLEEELEELKEFFSEELHEETGLVSENDVTPSSFKDRETVGIIKLFNYKFGFIRVENIVSDVYFTAGQITFPTYKAVRGTEVRFVLSTNSKGLMAKNIQRIKDVNPQTFQQTLELFSHASSKNVLAFAVNHIAAYGPNPNHDAALERLQNPSEDLLDFVSKVYQSLHELFQKAISKPFESRLAQSSSANTLTKQIAQLFSDDDLFKRFSDLVGSARFKLFSQTVEGIKKFYFSNFRAFDSTQPLDANIVAPRHELHDEQEKCTWHYVCGWVVFRLQRIYLKNPEESRFLLALVDKTEEIVSFAQKRRRTIVLKKFVIDNFCRSLEDITFLLFQSALTCGPEILGWIKASCLCNNQILNQWSSLFNLLQVGIHGDSEQSHKLLKNFVYLYIKSRQKSWVNHNHFDPQPVPVFRSGLKAKMNSNKES